MGFRIIRPARDRKRRLTESLLSAIGGVGWNNRLYGKEGLINRKNAFPDRDSVLMIAKRVDKRVAG